MPGAPFSTATSPTLKLRDHGIATGIDQICCSDRGVDPRERSRFYPNRFVTLVSKNTRYTERCVYTVSESSRYKRATKIWNNEIASEVPFFEENFGKQFGTRALRTCTCTRWIEIRGGNGSFDGYAQDENTEMENCIGGFIKMFKTDSVRVHPNRARVHGERKFGTGWCSIWFEAGRKYEVRKFDRWIYFRGEFCKSIRHACTANR